MKDNTYMDVFWGLSFVFPLAALIVKKYIKDGQVRPDLRAWITFGLVTSWALRLSIHIGLRLNGEDFRYKKWREEWTALGGTWGYIWRSLVNVFMIQGLVSLVNNASSIFIVIYSASGSLIWLDYVGIVIAVFGFGFEWLADDQLRRHLAEKNPGMPQFIKWGLWRYSRHPNYFGETVFWLGIYLIACSINWGWITFFAPLTITLLMRFYSGVAMLEDKYSDNLEFQAYKQETNVYVPWFVRS